MSQNVPALAVLVLLCAPGLVWSEEIRPTNDPHLGKGYYVSNPHFASTGVMQDRNTSPAIKLLPVYSISNRQNVHRSSPEKSLNFGSGYREESQHIPAYVVRPPQTTILKTILPRGMSSHRIEGSNSPRINSAFRGGSTLPQGRPPQRKDESNPPLINSTFRGGSPSPMISSIASAEQPLSSGPLITMRGDAVNKVPIYVISPPFPGTASPTLNMAVLPRERINPEIIKILQSLRLSEDKVPLVLVTGPLPALTIDSPNDEVSGINTVDFNSQDPSSRGRKIPLIGIISPHTMPEGEWHEPEMMKQETQRRGGRPSSSLRFTPISPQLYGKPGVLPPAYLHPLYPYQMKHPDNVPMNTVRFFVPREKSSPVNLFPYQKITHPEMRIPGGVWTNNRYPSQEQSKYPHDLRQLGLEDFADSQKYKPIQELEIPKYPYQYKAPYTPLPLIPQLSSSLLSNLPEKPGSEPPYSPQDSDLGPQYLAYPSSEVQEPHNSPFPSQEPPYSHEYRIPSDFQSKQSPEFPSYTGRAPGTQAPTDVFSQIGRLTIPETPSKYPSPVGEQPQIQPHSNILAQVGKMIVPGKNNTTFYQFPSTTTGPPSDHHVPFPHQSYPNQEAIYPISNLVPLSQAISDYDKTRMQLRPTQVGKATEEQSFPQGRFPAPPPKQVTQSIPHGETFPVQEITRQHPQSLSGSLVPDYSDQIPRPEPQHPSSDDEDHATGINTLDMPTDVSEPSHPLNPRPSLVVMGMEKFYIPEKHQKIPKLKYSQYPSSDSREPTNHAHQPFITLAYPSDEQALARPEQPYNKDSRSVRPMNYADAVINKFTIPEPSIIKPQQEYQRLPSADDQKQMHYPDSTYQQPHKGPQPDFPHEVQNGGYLWNPAYEEEPQMRLRPDVPSTIEKINFLERPYSPGNLQVAPYPEYPTFDSQPPMSPRTNIVSTTVNKLSIPEQPYSKPQQAYPHGGPQEPYREVDSKMWPMDATEPEMRPRSDVVSGMEIISVTEQPYTNTQRKYPRIASSDTDGSIYYPDGPFKQPFELQLKEYPHTPTYGTVPQMKPRPDAVSTIEMINLPEHTFDKPMQKIQTPSSDIEEPTIHFDSIPNQSYTGQSSNIPLNSQVFNEQTHPTEGTESEGLEKPNIVTRIEKFAVPEQSYYMPEEKYPLNPSSDSGKPSYYPDRNLQPPPKVQYPDYPSDGSIRGYPEYPIDNTQSQIKHRPHTVSIIEKFGIPHSSSLLPNKKQPMVFPTVVRAVDYSTHPTDYMGPKIRPKPNVLSMIEEIIIPEQGYPKQKYPFIPSSENGEPTHYPDSGPQHLPGDQYPAGLSSEPRMRPRPDITPNMEVISRTEEPYPSFQPKFPLIPSSETGEPTYYPDIGPQLPSRDQNTAGIPSESQIRDYPLYPTSFIQPQLKPRPAVVSSMETISMVEPTHSTNQQEYPLIPSSGAGEPSHYPDESFIGQQPSHFPFERQVEPTREPQVKARPGVVSSMEMISIIDQPYTTPHQKYPLIPSTENDEPTKYSHSIAHQPGGYPEYPIDAPQVRPTPEPVFNIQEFSIPEPFHTVPQQKQPNTPSSDTSTLTMYPEIPSQGRNADLLYPEIPASLPGSTKQPLDSSQPTNVEGGPRPVVGFEVQELIIPEGQQVYKGQQPEFSSKVPISEFSIHTSDKEPSIRPRPETVSEIEKIQIPKPQPSMPQLEYPQYPTYYPDEQFYHTDGGLQPKFVWNPYVDNRMPWLGKQPFKDSPVQIMRPHSIGSEVRKFYVPENYHPTPDETYPPSNTDVTKHYPDEGPQPFNPNQQLQFPLESHIPIPNVPTQIEKLYITEEPQLGQIGKFPPYQPSYRDYYAGPLDNTLKPQYKDQPQVQDKPEILSEIGKYDVPIQGSPQYPSLGSSEPNELYQPEHQIPLSHDRKSHIPTDFQDHTSFHYPSSSKPSWTSPDTETHTNRYEVPRSTDSVATIQYPHLEQPSSDNQFPKQEAPLFYDISIPTAQPQQDVPQYPSYGRERIPERPNILSQTEVLKTTETPPELRSLQEGEQIPESFSSPSLPGTPTTEVQRKQVHPKKEPVSLTSDILANVERFKIPEVLHSTTRQEYPTHFPRDGSLPKAHVVSGSNLRPSNDIDINIERLTVQGQRPRRPLAQHPPSTDTQKPNEYPETYSPYPVQVHLIQMKPDQPVGGDLMPENSEHNPGSTPYPHKAIYVPSIQPHPSVATEVKRFSLPDQPLEVSTQQYRPYSSTENEPGKYPSVSHQLPIKKFQPHIPMTTETFDITESPDSQRFETLPPFGRQEQPTSGSTVYSFPPGYPPRHHPQRLYTVTEEPTALDLDYVVSQEPVGDKPKESKNPRVYVYPVPIPSALVPPESYRPQLERRLSGTPLVEPYGYSLSTPGYRTPVETSYSIETTPSMLQSTSMLPEDKPKESKNPRLYVYPVPIPSALVPPESYRPQLERRLSGTPLVEPYGYSLSTPGYRTPVETSYSIETSPSMLQSTSTLPEDFPNDLTRSLQGQPQPSGSIAYLPHDIENHEPTSQTPREVYAVDTLSEPSINVQYTTPSYSDSFPRQSVVSSISPDGPILYLEPSARETTGSTTLAYPKEPTKTVVESTPERIILQPASERVLQIALDGPRKVNLLDRQPLGPEKIQPVEEVRQPSGDSSSVNTIDFPHSTEGAVNKQKPGSTTLPSVDENMGFYPNNDLTTTGQSIEPTPNESPLLPTTAVPIRTSKKLLDEPLSGDFDLSSLSPTSLKPGTSSFSSDFHKKPSIEPDSKITTIFPVTKPTFYTDKDGHKFVSLKLLNEPISASSPGYIVSRELTDSTQHPGTTDLVIPVGQEISDMPTTSLSQNAAQSSPMLKDIPIGNVQVFDAQTIIKVIERCNCSNLKFLIPILKRPQSAIVVANNENPANAN